jgi:hypothetical protein
MAIFYVKVIKAKNPIDEIHSTLAIISYHIMYKKIKHFIIIIYANLNT